MHQADILIWQDIFGADGAFAAESALGNAGVAAETDSRNAEKTS